MLKGLAGDTYLGRYLLRTREPVYSLLFLVPLLVLYEVYAVFINFNSAYQIRNGADIILKEFMRLLGIGNLFTMMMVILFCILVGAALNYRKTRAPLHPAYFGMMLGESVLYAFFLGPVTQRITGFFGGFALASPGVEEQAGNFSMKLMVSLGAGVYEEIVFRVVLVMGLYYLSRKVLLISDRNAWIFAILFSSLIFSSFHYIGRYRYEFSLGSFLYRFTAGVVLALLYIARGLGITAWTHSLYDVFILLDIG